MPQRQAEHGLYCPDDTLWRIHSEILLMLGGARALMLELAHPLIAAGVARHSDFQSRPLRRLTHTVRTMVMLTFGDSRMAQTAARHTHHCHALVQGTLGETVGMLPAGTAYDANDPALRLWVFATLIDTTLLVHDEFVRPLTPAEKSAYYEDSKRLAGMLGVPSSVMLADYAAFQAYVSAMIGGDTLAVGAQAQAIMQALFGHPLFGPVARIGSYAGMGLLPDHLRAAFGFRWDARDQRRLRSLAATSRRLRAVIPDALCSFPAATYYAWRYHRSAL
jgi:uncharacterized protein (DUF2236 family)